MTDFKPTANEIHKIFHEIEIDKIVEGLKANCLTCADMNPEKCIVCQEFKKLKNELNDNLDK